MKKPLKYGLIAGTAVIAVLIIYGYNKGRPRRLPTLPAPPGAIVPAGMRYVGGDEFDGADGTKPATMKVVKRDTATTAPEFEIRSGALHFAPIQTESLRSSTIGVAYHSPIDMRIPGRLEVRTRMRLSEYTKIIAQELKSLKKSYTVKVFFGVLCPPTDGYEFDVFRYNPYEVDESGETPIKSNNLEEYCTHALQWRQGKITFYENGVASPEHDLGNEWVLPAWLVHSSLLPKSLSDRLEDWTEWAPNKTPYNFVIKFQNFIPRNDPSQRDIMEIDYIRIFQE